jgi:endonuclease/exonuclease/phosphatase family metal-dependent hydrolase
MNHLSKNKFTPLFFVLSILWYLPGMAQEKTETRKLKILTYNVKFLPRFLVHIRHHPLKRAPLIADAILSDSVDIVVLQEVFDARARKILEKKMTYHFPYIIGPGANRPKGWKRGSGVMVLSRFPLKPLEKTVYSQCKKIDCVARKGVMAVQVDFNGQILQVFGTHMQSEGSVPLMMLQHKEFGEVLRQYSQQGVPQISLGDFNTAKEDTVLYRNLLKELQSEDGDLIGDLPFTFDHTQNDMDYSKDKPGVIDYVFYKGNGVPLQRATREVRIYRKRWSKHNQDLSDHFAVLAHFEF